MSLLSHPAPRWRGACAVAWLAMLPALPACTLLQPVRAWEKGVLAKAEMSFEADALDAKFVEHTYSSKEGAAGGSGVGAGGCGCN